MTRLSWGSFISCAKAIVFYRSLKSALVCFVLLFSLLHSQYYFGKNKVIYTDKDWLVLSSPHFNLYIAKELKSVGEQALAYAEEGAERMIELYQHRPAHVIPIVIYPNTVEFANNTILPGVLGEGTGGFTEIQKNRVVIPFNGRLEDFRHVLIHELSHAWQFSIMFGSEGASLSVLNTASSPPLWFMEGVSEFVSREGMDEETEKYIRETVLQGAFPDIKTLSSPFALGKQQYLIYKGGQAFFEWLDTIYDRDTIADFLFFTLSTGDIDLACSEIFQKSLEDLGEEWLSHLKAVYWPSIREYQLDHKGLARPLSDASESIASFHLFPVYGPEDRYIYYLGNENVYPEVLRKNIRIQPSRSESIARAGTAAEFESINIMYNSLSTSSNKTLLSYSSVSGNSYLLHRYNTVEEETLEKHTLENFDALFETSLSPDGSRLYFSATKDQQNDLFVYSFSNKSTMRLSRDRFTKKNPVVAFRKGREYLYYVDNSHSGAETFDYRLYRMDPKSSEIENLDLGFDNYSMAKPSPNGERLAFIASESNIFNLYLYEEDRGLIFQLTKTASDIGSFDWSSDGKTIVFSSLSRSVEELYEMNIPTVEKCLRNFPFRLHLQEGAEEPAIKRTENPYASYTPLFDIHQNKYQLRYQSDYLFFLFGLNSALGLGGRAFAGFSDILSERKIYVDADVEYFQAYDLLDTDTSVEFISFEKRLNVGWQVNLYQQNILTEFDYNEGDQILKGFTEAQYGLGLLLRYPFSRYFRIDGSLLPTYYSRRYFGDPSFEDRETYPELDKLSMQLRLSLTQDNTLSGYLYPIDNSRFHIKLDGSPSWSENTLGYFRIWTDFRYYIMFGLRASLAFRLQTGWVTGPDSDEFRFRLGGPSYSSNFPTLRGYPLYAFSGKYLQLFNLEYRSAFLRYAEFAFPFRWRIGNINSVVFLDLGGTSENIEAYSPWLRAESGELALDDLAMGFGFGLRFVFAGLPFKIDTAAPYRGGPWPSAVNWTTRLSIGLDY